jgi:hypothetical protein
LKFGIRYKMYSIEKKLVISFVKLIMVTQCKGKPHSST